MTRQSHIKLHVICVNLLILWMHLRQTGQKRGMVLMHAKDALYINQCKKEEAQFLNPCYLVSGF